MGHLRSITLLIWIAPFRWADDQSGPQLPEELLRSCNARLDLVQSKPISQSGVELVGMQGRADMRVGDDVGSSLPDDMTDLLRAWGRGDPKAAEKLTPLIYGELKRMAAERLRAERQDHTLQPTDLVHEAYLRIFDRADISWQNRAQFFAITANMMRRILVDHARRRRRGKRGAGIIRVDLGHAAELPCRRTPDIVALDDALHDLAAVDPRKSSIVELHFFGGLSVAETAEVLSCSTATVTRHWRMAKAWLLRELGEDQHP